MDPQKHQQYDRDCLSPRLPTIRQRANVLVRLRCFAIYARQSSSSRMPGLSAQLQLVPVRLNVHTVKEHGREIAQKSQKYNSRRPSSDAERHPCSLSRQVTIERWTICLSLVDIRILYFLYDQTALELQLKLA